MHLFSGFFILILFAFYCDIADAKLWNFRKSMKSPVVLVPGDGGSQVEARLNKTDVPHYICSKLTTDYFSIWLNLELLVPVVIDCWVDNMKLTYDNETRTTSNSPGVETRIPQFGDPFPVEWLDPTKASPGAYFKDIGDALVSNGYVRNISLRGAPYDFRKAPNENQDYFKNLQYLIEETYHLNSQTPVTLIAHSMGGPMSLHFLQSMSQKWKDVYISKFITLSGAWGGSIKALKVYAVGDDLGVYILREKTLREMQITSPSLAWLLPSGIFWKPLETLIQTENKNYSLSNLNEFFDEIDYPVAWEMRKDVEKYSIDFTAPGVEVHCIHGYGVNTVERLVYADGKFPSGYPKFVYGDGDGTVNARSLEGCMHWKFMQKPTVYHQKFPDVDHMAILRDKRVISYINQLLTIKS